MISQLFNVFTFSSHTEYVKKESIVLLLRYPKNAKKPT